MLKSSTPTWRTPKNKRPNWKPASIATNGDEAEYDGCNRRAQALDLLREAGRPTLVILDATPVHSDSARLEDMKRILCDAASRHHILLFTRQPGN